MPTPVQSITGESITANPTSVAFSPATTVGNRIVVGVITDHSGGTGAVTAVSGGGVTTWALDNDQGNGGSPTGVSLEIWSGIVTSSSTTGITFTWSLASNTHLIWLIQEWPGLGAFDKASTLAAGTSSALLSTGTGVLAQADSTVFGLGGWRLASGTRATGTVGAGYSNFITFGSTNGNILTGGLESQLVAATTSVTAAMTLSNATNNWAAVAAAYKNAAASAPGTQPIVGGMSPAVARSSFW